MGPAIAADRKRWVDFLQKGPANGRRALLLARSHGPAARYTVTGVLWNVDVKTLSAWTCGVPSISGVSDCRTCG